MIKAILVKKKKKHLTQALLILSYSQSIIIMAENMVPRMVLEQ